MRAILTTAMIALTIIGSTSSAANMIEPYETAVGADVIVRQVLTKNLLSQKDQSLKKYLVSALEGSGRSPERSTMTTIVCDRALGADDCSITFVISDDAEAGNEGSSFKLNTKIRNGKVVSATIDGFIG